MWSLGKCGAWVSVGCGVWRVELNQKNATNQKNSIFKFAKLIIQNASAFSCLGFVGLLPPVLISSYDRNYSPDGFCL